MGKRYLKGKRSINSYLPIPTICQLEGYTYISWINVICDLLGHGLPSDKIKGIIQESQ